MACCAASTSFGNDYSENGPYSTESKAHRYEMGTFTGCKGRQCCLTVTVTKPRALDDGTYVTGRSPPFPAVFFLNGFQMFSSYYRDYVQFLVSWGYVVVQYDLPVMTITTDKVELRYLNPLLDWLENENNDGHSFLHQLVDMGRLAMAGHSRGAKLAALHLIQNSRIKGAYLIDPVDNDKKYAPESEDNPSAVKALASAGKRVGIVGSGKVGSCNPPGENFVQFWGAVANGSWLTVVSNCSHSQFLDAPPFAQAMFNILCGTGKATNKNVIRATRPGLVAWMEDMLYAAKMKVTEPQTQTSVGQQAPGSFLDGFFHWVKEMEQEEVLTFNVKTSSAQEVDQKDLQTVDTVALATT